MGEKQIEDFWYYYAMLSIDLFGSIFVVNIAVGMNA